MPRRPKSGDRRIDAAIDHFVPMGFKKVDIRNIVNSLLKNVYGNNGWLFLEENCYHVVQEALLEKQEEEEKLQLQVLQKKQQQQQQEEEEEEEEEQQQQDDDDEEAQHVQEQQQEEWEDEDEDQQQDAAMVGTLSGNRMPVVQVHNEEPSNTVLAVEQTEEVIIDPPAPKALPHLAATRSGRARRPCFGWISESDSDSDYEEFLASRQQVVHVPAAGGDLGKRKRLTRWDVKKEAT
ncbi:hypothetical protein ACQ4PT_009385 [Festuca glaucescens]